MNAISLPRQRRLHRVESRRAGLYLGHGTGAFLATMLLAQSVPSRVEAIQFIQDYNQIARPAFDPNGTELRRIATAAAIIWEDFILDDRTFEYDLAWADLEDDDRLGEYEYNVFSDDTIHIDTQLANGTPRKWFFDPTPLEYDEFSMNQYPYSTGIESQFSGTPPERLEISNIGIAIVPASVGRYDLLTTVLHEMGHLLGINTEIDDDEYDINPATLGGAHVAVKATDEEGLFSLNHLQVSGALMGPKQFPGERRLPSAIDILTMWDEGGFTQFDLPRVEFLGAQSTSWDETLNWIGGRVPDGDNEVAIRHGGQVRLMSTFSSARSLKVEGNSSLSMFDNNFLWVEGLMSVGAEGLGEAHVNVGGLSPGFPELEAGALQIRFGYVNLQSPSSLLIVNGITNIGPSGELLGAGTVYARGLLENDGEILGGSFFGGGELALRTQFGGRLDLDGASEQGRLTTAYGNLRISGLQHEPFSGTASITSGRRITIEQSFAVDGSIVFTGDPLFHNTSLLGTELWLRGRIDVTGNANIEAPLMIFNNPAQVTTVHAGGELYLSPGRMGIGSAPDVYRGRIVLEQDATLLLNVGLASSWELSGSMNMTNATVTGDSIMNTGHLRGSGTLYVGKLENSGTVNVGDPIGVLNLGEGGRYVQTASGTLGIEASGFRPGTRYDQLKVTLGASLDGALSVSFINGYLPASGTRFDVLTAASISGQFASLELSAPQGRYIEGHLIYGTDRVTLEILASGFTADFDMDGDVDGADLLRWKEGFGRAHRREQGDADGDLDVDGADFLAWQQQLGSVSSVPTAAAVPEPATLLLFVLASAGFRRKR